jgi:hypothetical protein
VEEMQTIEVRVEGGEEPETGTYVDDIVADDAP